MEPALKDEGGSVALNPPYGGMKDETDLPQERWAREED
jgi:hypothetical protein